MISALNEVSDLDIPVLQPYRTLKGQKSHRDQGVFVAEGELVVRRLLESALTVSSVLLTPAWFENYRARLDERAESIEVFIAPQPVLVKIVGYAFHRGIMALAKVPKPLSLDQAVSCAGQPGLIVALDNIGSAENLGVIARNCAACGVDAIIVGQGCADPYLRRAVRNSMGTVFRLPIVRADDLADTLQMLRSRHGFRVLAAHPQPGSMAIQQADLQDNCCIILGHEGSGISPAIVSTADLCVRVPMASGIDSFNVACAGAAILYEIRRQRGFQ